jgi:hypothetical protein
LDGRAAELGASDDAITQMLWRQTRAKVYARPGERADAERLAREAVAIGEDTDFLDAQADAKTPLHRRFSTSQPRLGIGAVGARVGVAGLSQDPYSSRKRRGKVPAHRHGLKA